MCLTFWRSGRLFSIAAESFRCPPAYLGLPTVSILANTYFPSFGGCEVVSHCGSDWHFPGDWWRGPLSMCLLAVLDLLWRRVSSDHLPALELDNLSFYCCKNSLISSNTRSISQLPVLSYVSVYFFLALYSTMILQHYILVIWKLFHWFI